MSKFKFFNYQEKLLESKENTIVNWARTLGKTYISTAKIAKEQPKKVLIIYHHNYHIFKIINSYLTRFEKTVLEYSHDKIVIENPFYDNTEIYIKSTLDKFNDDEFEDTDLIILENGLPISSQYSNVVINDSVLQPLTMSNITEEWLQNHSKQWISLITTNNYYKKLQGLYPNCKILEADYKVGIQNNALDKNFVADERHDTTERIFKSQWAIFDPIKETY